MIQITLVCAAGMSTSLLMSKMEKAAAEMNVDVKIRATPEAQFKAYEKETDILLLGPQVSYIFEKMKKKYEPMGMKVSVVDTVDYGMMNGEKVLKKALGL